METQCPAHIFAYCFTINILFLEYFDGGAAIFCCKVFVNFCNILQVFRAFIVFILHVRVAYINKIQIIKHKNTKNN